MREKERPLVPGFRDKTVRRASKERPDPSRNVGALRGPAVTAQDISQYALQMHPKCGGKGMVVLEASGDLPRRAVPCTCAMKRFFKAHPEVIILRTGQAFWPKVEKADTEDDAAAQLARAVDRAMEGA